MKPAAPAATPINPGVTEADAMMKWCSEARVPIVVGTGMVVANRTGQGPVEVPNGSTCMGNACMKWLWVEAVEPLSLRTPDDRDPSIPDGEDRPKPERPVTVPPTWAGHILDDGSGLIEWSEPEAEAQARRRGRCGLAGQ